MGKKHIAIFRANRATSDKRKISLNESEFRSVTEGVNPKNANWADGDIQKVGRCFYPYILHPHRSGYLLHHGQGVQTLKMCRC